MDWPKKLQSIEEENIKDRIDLIKSSFMYELESQEILAGPIAKAINNLISNNSKRAYLGCILLDLIVSAGRLGLFEKELPMLMSSLLVWFEKNSTEDVRAKMVETIAGILVASKDILSVKKQVTSVWVTKAYSCYLKLLSYPMFELTDSTAKYLILLLDQFSSVSKTYQEDLERLLSVRIFKEEAAIMALAALYRVKSTIDGSLEKADLITKSSNSIRFIISQVIDPTTKSADIENRFSVSIIGPVGVNVDAALLQCRSFFKLMSHYLGLSNALIQPNSIINLCAKVNEVLATLSKREKAEITAFVVELKSKSDELLIKLIHEGSADLFYWRAELHRHCLDSFNSCLRDGSLYEKFKSAMLSSLNLIGAAFGMECFSETQKTVVLEVVWQAMDGKINLLEQSLEKILEVEKINGTLFSLGEEDIYFYIRASARRFFNNLEAILHPKLVFNVHVEERKLEEVSQVHKSAQEQLPSPITKKPRLDLPIPSEELFKPVKKVEPPIQSKPISINVPVIETKTYKSVPEIKSNSDIDAEVLVTEPPKSEQLAFQALYDLHDDLEDEEELPEIEMDGPDTDEEY